MGRMEAPARVVKGEGDRVPEYAGAGRGARLPLRGILAGTLGFVAAYSAFGILALFWGIVAGRPFGESPRVASMLWRVRTGRFLDNLMVEAVAAVAAGSIVFGVQCAAWWLRPGARVRPVWWAAVGAGGALCAGRWAVWNDDFYIPVLRHSVAHIVVGVALVAALGTFVAWWRVRKG